jgi:hypothetical protein
MSHPRARAATTTCAPATTTRAAATPLPVIEVASPCTVDWERMTGDEQSRFCAHCDRHVHDLSAMGSEEVIDLVCESAGRLCVRFERTVGGEVKTLDYQPAPSARSRWRAVISGVVLAVATAIGAGVLVESLRPRRTMGMMRIPPPAIGPGGTAAPASPTAPAPAPGASATESDATCPTP